MGSAKKALLCGILLAIIVPSVALGAYTFLNNIPENPVESQLTITVNSVALSFTHQKQEIGSCCKSR